MLAQLVESERVLGELKRLESGSLAIAVTSTVNYFLSRVVGAFVRQYPEVAIRLEVTNRESLLDQLTNNEPDLVLMGQPPADMSLVFEPFMENPLVVIAAPSHPLARKRRVALSALNQERFLLREAGSGTRIAMQRAFTKNQIDITEGLVMNSNEAIKQGVEAGLGLGFVSRHTLEQELSLRRLVELKVETFPVMRRWFVVHRTDRVLSAVAQAFRDFVLTESRRLASSRT